MNTNEIKKIAVIGAGAMGHSIALVFAKAGLDVWLVDTNNDSLNHAKILIKKELKLFYQWGIIQNIESIFLKINFTTLMEESAKDCDFVIETVSEDINIKQKVFQQLDALCPEKTIFSSNTSTLDIFSFVSTKRPDRLLMLHWFNPAHIIPLVEISTSVNTSDNTLKTAQALMNRVDKKQVLLKKFTPSLIVNRIQSVIATEALRILSEGVASAQEIDFAIKASLGVRLPIVGILQSLDFTGLQLVSIMSRHQNKIIEELVARGNFGISTAKGLYDYNGRKEEDILRKRDKLYVDLLSCLEKINAFEPI